jgi:hypothetical protein
VFLRLRSNQEEHDRIGKGTTESGRARLPVVP